MSSKRKVVELQAAPAQRTSEETRAEDLFNKQKAYFASDATKVIVHPPLNSRADDIIGILNPFAVQEQRVPTRLPRGTNCRTSKCF